MTLEEMKLKIYSMIEEYNEDSDELTEDEDLATKMNSVINQIQNELSRYKKLPAYITMDMEKDRVYLFEEIADDIYQMNMIRGIDTQTVENTVICNESGEAKVYYYKYPTQIDNDTPDSYKFELPIDLLEILPYGVAGDLLKSDVSSQYGQIYSNRYRELIQQLDPRYSSNTVYIDGGVEV